MFLSFENWKHYFQSTVLDSLIQSQVTDDHLFANYGSRQVQRVAGAHLVTQ